MLLLDTCVVLFLANDTIQLSSEARQHISQARIGAIPIAIASVTLWEVALLSAKNRIRLTLPVEVFLEQLEAIYTVLPLDRTIALIGSRFSADYPKDPADRQIGATALRFGLSLITSDEKIRLSDEVACIW